MRTSGVKGVRRERGGATKKDGPPFIAQMSVSWRLSHCDNTKLSVAEKEVSRESEEKGHLLL
jgi:hypothetical protein